jgi:hypothetical protein
MGSLKSSLLLTLLLLLACGQSTAKHKWEVHEKVTLWANKGEPQLPSLGLLHRHWDSAVDGTAGPSHPGNALPPPCPARSGALLQPQ